MGFIDYIKGRAAAFGEYRRTQVEMYDRFYIRMEPWTHDNLHWGADGTLHGTVAGPDGVRPPTTRTGWCACLPIDADPHPEAPGELPDLADRRT